MARARNRNRVALISGNIEAMRFALVLLAGCGSSGSMADGPVGSGDGPPPSGACAQAGGYRSSFSADENPVSEGGFWTQGGKATSLDWTDIRTMGGLAIGTQTGQDGYDDSIALAKGCGANQRVSATVHLKMPIVGTGSHEVELILRGSSGPHQLPLYECNLGYADSSGSFYAQIVRQNGPLGSFEEIDTGVANPLQVHDGDVFSAEIVGTQIRTFLNGAPISTANDAVLGSGAPGIGMFWRGTESISDFAFSDVTVETL